MLPRPLCIHLCFCLIARSLYIYNASRWRRKPHSSLVHTVDSPPLNQTLRPLRDQQGKIASKRAELQGDPSAKGPGKGSTRVAEHKSLAMYDAFGSGGGEGWGGGGGTRGDDYDFM